MRYIGKLIHDLEGPLLMNIAQVASWNNIRHENYNGNAPDRQSWFCSAPVGKEFWNDVKTKRQDLQQETELFVRQQWKREDGKNDGLEYYLTITGFIPRLHGIENRQVERDDSDSENRW